MIYTKKETFTVKEFLTGQPKVPTHSKKSLVKSIYSFFPPITISSFFPVAEPSFALFLVGGAVITLVALTEYGTASQGFQDISIFISGITKILFPLVGYGVIFWFLFRSLGGI